MRTCCGGNARHLRGVRGAHVSRSHGGHREGLRAWHRRAHRVRPMGDHGRTAERRHLQHPAGAPVVPQHDPAHMDPHLPEGRAEGTEPGRQDPLRHAHGEFARGLGQLGRAQGRDRRAHVAPQGCDLWDHDGSRPHDLGPAVARLPLADRDRRLGRDVPERARPRVRPRPAGAALRGPRAAPASDRYDEHADPAPEPPRQGEDPLPLLLRLADMAVGGDPLRVSLRILDAVRSA
mmetsp:Transcript_48181/g.124330  ORF Transcript_48181/g.124330 Transcript_48181/m.124330 type:complete len:234 (+) Transcript_48181:471-1172(+)